MMRWLFRTWPPPLVLFLAGLAVFILELPQIIFEWRFGVELLQEFRIQPGLFLLYLFSVILGGYRIVYFHPHWRSAYANWLKTTPWVVHKPLPLGPIHFVWQDLLLVGIGFTLVWLLYGRWSIVVVLVFLFTYLILLGISLLLTGERNFAYVLWAFLGLLLLFRNYPLWEAPIALAAYLVGILGLKRSLRSFPWPENSWDVTAEQSAKRIVGWPFGVLAPKPAKPLLEIDLWDAGCVSLLTGWGYLVANDLILEYETDNPQAFIALLAILSPLPIALIRVIMYVLSDTGVYLPPISLAGRLITGRWIIPGYDQIFAAPMLAVTAAFGLLALVGAMPLNQILDESWINPVMVFVVIPVMMFVVVFILLGMGPKRRVWQLTGDYRFSPSPMGTSNKANMVEAG